MTLVRLLFASCAIAVAVTGAWWGCADRTPGMMSPAQAQSGGIQYQKRSDLQRAAVLACIKDTVAACHPTGTIFLRTSVPDEYTSVPATLGGSDDYRIYAPDGVSKAVGLKIVVTTVPDWVRAVYPARQGQGFEDSVKDPLITVYVKWHQAERREQLVVWIDFGSLIKPPFRFYGPRLVEYSGAPDDVYFYQSGCRPYYFTFKDATQRTLVSIPEKGLVLEGEIE
jgi:hypothetical protein